MSTKASRQREYEACLRHERRLFAWCLIQSGTYSPEQAQSEAERFYPHKSEDDPHRWLVFHDEAWHWAMLTIYGAGYWLPHPELAKPSEAYREESKRFDRE